MRYALHSTAIVLGALAAACGTSRETAGPSETPSALATGVLKTLEVASSRVECTGVGLQACLQVRESASAPWTLLYEPIAGFDYEPGFTYKIQVREEAVANPPADASSVRRTLVSVLSKTAAPPSLIGPSWRLVSIEGKDAVPGVRVTAVFAAEDLVAGSAGCNRYFGRAAVAGDRLEMGLMASTMMYCGSDGVMPQEQAYLSALEKVKTYRVSGHELRLGPSASATSLVFALE